jgi:hypothetical protein
MSIVCGFFRTVAHLLLNIILIGGILFVGWVFYTFSNAPDKKIISINLLMEYGKNHPICNVDHNLTYVSYIKFNYRINGCDKYLIPGTYAVDKDSLDSRSLKCFIISVYNIINFQASYIQFTKCYVNATLSELEQTVDKSFDKFTSMLSLIFFIIVYCGYIIFMCKGKSRAEETDEYQELIVITHATEIPTDELSERDTKIVETSEDCSICLEEILPGTNVYVFSCGHNFHRECIGKWLNTDNSCPNCKDKLLKNVF